METPKMSFEWENKLTHVFRDTCLMGFHVLLNHNGIESLVVDQHGLKAGVDLQL